MIYETSSETNNSNNTVVQTTNSHHQIVFENGLSQSHHHHHQSAATESAKIATEPSHDINLPNDEDLLKRLENADNPDAIVTGIKIEEFLAIHCLKITENVAFEFFNFGISHQFLSY